MVSNGRGSSDGHDRIAAVTSLCAVSSRRRGSELGYNAIGEMSRLSTSKLGWADKNADAVSLAPRRFVRVNVVSLGQRPYRKSSSAGI